MGGKWLPVAVLMVALAWPASPTYALNCPLARTTIEKSICGHPQPRLAAEITARKTVLGGWPVAVAVGGDPAIEIAPMHTIGASAVYPRLTRFPDARVMAAVNVLLAVKEKADRAAYADCLSDLKDTRQKPDADTYSEDVTVRYFSRRILSITIRVSSWCGGPYPNNGVPAPVTVDLRTGRAIDWPALFKPGFLPSGDSDEHAPPSVLTKLYRTRYAAGNDAGCRTMVNEADPFSSPPVMWLDVHGGLVVEPDFPHVTAACADDMALSPTDLAPYLRDTALLDDLRATVKPATR